jgi:DNA-binding response OmpR family regulator
MSTPSRPVRILVYSDDVSVRDQVKRALGTRLYPDSPEISYLEVATAPVVIGQLDAGDIDLAILDGEATPTGGMGLAKQIKDEVVNPPPIVVLTGRRDDAWLAKWSRAEAAVPHPIDPMRLTDVVTGLLRTPAR